MKIINLNICFWTLHDSENRLRNTKFSWEKLKKFIEFCRKKEDNILVNGFLFDLSEEKNLEEAIHLPQKEKTYERSKKINLCIEHNYLYNKPDIICFLDSDVFFEESQYEKFYRILSNFDSKIFYTSRVLDIQDNSGVNFNTLSISDDIKIAPREIPGLGAFFIVDFKSLFDLGGFDERFIVWGGEDDDLKQRLVRTGLIRKDIPIALYHLNHDTGLIHHANVLNSSQKQKQLDVLFNDKSNERNTLLTKHKTNFKISDAISLLTPFRFDINAKLIYAKYREKNINTNYHKNIYLEHIRVWNNFYEESPRKNSSSDFLNSFDNLLDSVKNNGFISKELNFIPTKNNSPYNGAHRVAACILHKKEVYTLENESNGQYNCNYKYFINKGLKQEFADEMALEYVRNKKNVFTISLFDTDESSISKAEKIIEEYSNVIYSKNVELTELGKHNYVISLYRNEKWIGNYNNYFSGAYDKMKWCFENSNKFKFYIVEPLDDKKLIECKNKIRQLYNRGNHSVHINDTYEETWNLSTMICNKNSLDFFNKNKYSNFDNFNLLLSKYRNMIKGIDSEDFCITSSAVLSLYNLRDCNDIDFFSKNKEYENYKSNDLSNHDSELKFYNISKDDLIYNPENYLYYEGLKFVTLENINSMKKKRNENKDILDCQLIESN